MPRRAFTFIEVLVVIGIVAVLLALLAPAVQRVRYNARLTGCQANLRDLIVAMNHYAADHDRQWPSFDMPETGRNLWDVSHGFVDGLRRDYGLKHETFFCPTAQQTLADETFTTYSEFYIIGYNVWVPRWNGDPKQGGAIMPPLQPGTGPYTFPQPMDTKPFAGPRGPGDPLAGTNPAFTDIVGSDMTVTPPANADPSVTRNPYQLSSLTTHQINGRFIGINAGFADGHVENVPGKLVRPRYAGNRWNWR